MKDRYRYDTGMIIDQKNGDILTTKQAVNRLNRQERRIRHRTKHIEAVIKQLNKEIDNANTDELKQALIRIANTELEI
jgi:uncharacterized protein YwgA